METNNAAATDLVLVTAILAMANNTAISIPLLVAVMVNNALVQAAMVNALIQTNKSVRPLHLLGSVIVLTALKLAKSARI